MIPVVAAHRADHCRGSRRTDCLLDQRSARPPGPVRARGSAPCPVMVSLCAAMTGANSPGPVSPEISTTSPGRQAGSGCSRLRVNTKMPDVSSWTKSTVQAGSLTVMTPQLSRDARRRPRSAAGPEWPRPTSTGGARVVPRFSVPRRFRDRSAKPARRAGPCRARNRPARPRREAARQRRSAPASPTAKAAALLLHTARRGLSP